MEYFTREKVMPLFLTTFVILADQITKAIIVKIQPLHPALIKDVFNNDLLWIYHVRNKAIAFSIGDGLPEPVKKVAFVIIPILVLVFLIWYYFRSDEFTKLQRWAIAGIVGGGIGNIIDRVFRPDGVVDFISVRIFGLFGWERWPTFNIADSSVVVCCLLLFATILINPEKKAKVQTDE
jgi:signal peptidase II